MVYPDTSLILINVIMACIGAFLHRAYINHSERFERSVPLHECKEREKEKQRKEYLKESKQRLKKNRRLNSINNEIFIV